MRRTWRAAPVAVPLRALGRATGSGCADRAAGPACLRAAALRLPTSFGRRETRRPNEGMIPLPPSARGRPTTSDTINPKSQPSVKAGQVQREAGFEKPDEEQRRVNLGTSVG